MPLLAPVTTATVPSSLFVMDLHLGLPGRNATVTTV